MSEDQCTAKDFWDWFFFSRFVWRMAEHFVAKPLVLGSIPGMSEEGGKIFIGTNFPMHSAANWVHFKLNTSTPLSLILTIKNR